MIVSLRPKRTYHRHTPASHGGLFPQGFNNYEVIDFSSNVNPIGISEKVAQAIKNSISKASIYPDSDSKKIRKSLAKYTRLSPENILIGNGATEIIYHFCNAFLSKKQNVLIPIPTFFEYEIAAKLNDSKITFFQTLDLENDLKDFLKKIPRNGIIFLCNPNNPTGKLLKKEIISKIVSVAKTKGCFVFLDECFIELVPDHDESLIHQISKFQNLFILRSLTKSFGLAGIRLGYGIGNEKIISLLNKTKIPWNVSIVAQMAGIASLNDMKHLEKAKRLIKDESKYLKNSISQLPGFHIFDSSTNFFLIKTKINSKLVQKKLLRKKILVRDCSTFRGLGRNYIRIAVRTHNENKKLVSALEKLK